MDNSNTQRSGEDYKPILKKRDYNRAYEVYVEQGHWRMMEPNRMLLMLKELRNMNFDTMPNEGKKEPLERTIDTLRTRIRRMKPALISPVLQVQSTVVNTPGNGNGHTDGGYTWVGKN